jgi:hypothetical protein
VLPHPFQMIDTDLLEKNSIPFLEDAYGRTQEQMHELEISDPSSPARAELLAEMRELEARIRELRLKHNLPKDTVEPIQASSLLFG